MQFDHSWDALLRPGEASDHFAGLRPRWLDPRAVGYCERNAWWLAELSRLVYRQESDELGAAAESPTRAEILRPVGFREVGFISRGGTQCALIGPQHDSDAPFTILVFRGTHDLRDWLSNVKTLPVEWPQGGRVHRGFVEALDRVWGDVESRLSRTDGRVFVTGHSLGAALATLAASRRPPDALYTFGSPRVGDQTFVGTLPRQAVYRVVNGRDLVPTVPASFGPLEFCHAGELHWLAGDEQRRPRSSDLSVRRWAVEAPSPLSDHAPVNYVASLAGLL